MSTKRGLPPVAERTLIGAYERGLARTPDAQAQAGETGPVTFAGSFERSLRLAPGFAAHGIGPRQPAALRRRGENVSSFEVGRAGRSGSSDRIHDAPDAIFANNKPINSSDFGSFVWI